MYKSLIRVKHNKFPYVYCDFYFDKLVLKDQNIVKLSYCCIGGWGIPVTIDTIVLQFKVLEMVFMILR